MAIGIARGKADINVTPMIDVLLVLLIIFMVIMPFSVGLPVQVPQRDDGNTRPLPAQDLVLTVLGRGRVRLDDTDIDIGSLPGRLKDVMKQHSAGVVFVKSPGQMDFAEVAEVIDLAKGAGWTKIGLVPQAGR